MMTVADAFKILGTTVESVSHVLSENDIKGTIGSCRDCPIAKYLQSLGIDACVGPFYVDILDREDYEIPLTSNIKEWINLFDCGELPDFIS